MDNSFNQCINDINQYIITLDSSLDTLMDKIELINSQIEAIAHKNIFDRKLPQLNNILELLEDQAEQFIKIREKYESIKIKAFKYQLEQHFKLSISSIPT